MQKLLELIVHLVGGGVDGNLGMLYWSDVRVLVDVCVRELGEERGEKVGLMLVRCLGAVTKRDDYKEEVYR